MVDILQFAHCAPALILTPPSSSFEPDGKGLGKIFCRMHLRVPRIEVEDVIAASRLRLVPLRVRNPVGTERVRPREAGVEPDRIVQRMACSVPQNPHTPAFTR